MFTELLRLVVPVACPGCEEPDLPLCPRCAGGFAGPVLAVSPPAWPARPASGVVPVTAVARYEGAAREVLVGWKDGGRLELRAFLAGTLARSVMACVTLGGGDREQRLERPAGAVCLVPVPSSRSAVRRRGEDVMLQLARATADSLRANTSPARARRAAGSLAPVGDPGPEPSPGGGLRTVRVARLLVQAGGVRDQAGLDASQRVANTRGRLRMRRSSALVRWPGGRLPGVSGGLGERVVLVDDIVTTGASLAAAAEVLTAAGLAVAGAATVAWTPRRWAGTSGPHSPTLRTVEPGDAGLAWSPRPEERGERRGLERGCSSSWGAMW